MTRRRRKGDPARAVALTRVSTRKQDLGPEAQRAAIETWAEREGVEVVSWCQEHGVSGAADPLKRPGLQAALVALDEHRARWLVVHEESRLARDMDAAGYIRFVVRQHGAEVVTTDASGSRLEEGIRRVLADHERQEISKRTRRALAVRRAQGRRVSGRPPFGQRFSPSGDLEPEPRELAAIAEACEMRARGMTLRAIAEQLVRLGFMPREGTEWHPPSVSRLVKAGEVAQQAAAS